MQELGMTPEAMIDDIAVTIGHGFEERIRACGRVLLGRITAEYPDRIITRVYTGHEAGIHISYYTRALVGEQDAWAALP